MQPKQNTAQVRPANEYTIIGTAQRGKLKEVSSKRYHKHNTFECGVR